MTSGKDWQLPKRFCYSSWCTDPCSLLQKWRSIASSKQGQVLHVESNSISWKRYLFCLNHKWHWDVIFMFVLNRLRFRLELRRWFSYYSDKHARGRILFICNYYACFTHIKKYLWSSQNLQGDHKEPYATCCHSEALYFTADIWCKTKNTGYD